jgi:hypothetical protein
MKTKKIGSKYFIRIDRGEEIVESLKNFCKENGIKLGTVYGIGATSKAVVGFFEAETKKYHSKEFSGGHEIAPLAGNITTMNGETYLHLHINLCDAEQRSYGGHLNSAVVGATFEGFVDVMDGEIERELSEDIGLNLLKI